MASKVRFTARALASLDAADAYLRPRNPTAANNLRDEIERLTGLIADFPEMSPAIRGSKMRYHVTRRYRYRIVYRVIGRTIEIRDVLHPSRSGP